MDVIFCGEEGDCGDVTREGPDFAMREVVVRLVSEGLSWRLGPEGVKNGYSPDWVRGLTTVRVLFLVENQIKMLNQKWWC